MSNAAGEIPRHELLLKLLKMTNSPNDAEALVAVRKANHLLASAGWDWDKLLSGKITVVGDPFGNLQRPGPPTADSYTPMPTSPRAPPRPQATHPAPDYAAQAAANMAAQYQNQYQTPPRAKRARPAVNYDDIFSDAQTFGRTS